jgi:hypothetical protein
MKHSVEVSSGGVIYIPGFLDIGKEIINQTESHMQTAGLPHNLNIT